MPNAQAINLKKYQNVFCSQARLIFNSKLAILQNLATSPHHKIVQNRVSTRACVKFFLPNPHISNIKIIIFHKIL